MTILAACLRCAVAFGLVALLWGEACAQETATADEIKAAFLFHFASYVEWPGKRGPDQPVVLGIAGAHPIEQELRRIVRERGGAGRSLVVRRVAANPALPALDILFVGRDQAANLAALARAVEGRPVLVVSDAENALQHGSMINFITTDRVRFEVALDAAVKAGLRLSARLLAVALRVKQGNHPFFSGASIAALVPRPPSRASLNRLTTPSSASDSEG